mmetsp:Transcript_21285/g.48023  ORF Transcript_21285/g.48023 Transcript_21285/m.48023 type:complete len:238 (-) Transcript_21285:756-1469(-)|eukprot:CAMPEP_0172633888 /NCGR_PEP_ID=MMETSP1068-20121228/191759_1 /TAXON_ID=35684 /ORGANISM="Pseudopedinella elastica, Strain CCMP716" /LENGTH=237 /DNA_ID=CAMNT_0013445701 /DNA_START=59 /DNA_END=772 /DNA_ORIENTATION=+
MSQGKDFSAWFDAVNKDEGDKQDDEASLWSLFGGEKKTDGAVDPESQVSLLGGVSSWFDQVKAQASETTGIGQPQEQSLFGLSYQTRFKGFVASVLLSGFFFFMAFFIGLPVIVVRPSKFALCFTTGSLMYMSSFALLKGPGAHLASMVALDKLPFSICYVGSMFLTLYASLVARSYILVVVTSSLQLSTLAYYMLSFIPGGTAGARVFVAMVVRTSRIILAATITVCRQCLKLVAS